MLGRRLFVCFLVLGLVAAIVPSLGDDADRGNSTPRAFIGMWQAIDSLDGSTQLLSVTCKRPDDCDVRLNDSLFSLSCPNQIGFAQGFGAIDRGVLSVDLTLTCGDLTVTQFNEFVYDRENRTLTNLNDDPVPTPNVFHRISR